MKKFVLSWLILIIWALPVRAKTMYTSDITEINVRQGRDTSFPIVETLKSGQQVTVLESSHGWSKIQLANGKQGWLITGYLSDAKNTGVDASQFTKKIDDLSHQVQAATGENENLKKENLSLKSQIEDVTKNLSIMKSSNTVNPVETKEYLTLKANFDKVSAQLNEKIKKIEELEQQTTGTGIAGGVNRYYLYFFLAGAGVLALGIIIGSSTKRRRSSLL
jgi:SH3 domain protein